MQGLKDIEIRSWTTPFRGFFAIHASKIFDEEAFSYLNEILSIPEMEEYPMGVIVGYAYLFDVKEFKDKDAFVLFKDRHLNNPDWWEPSKVGFVLQEITSLPPFVSKGKLGLYSLKNPLHIET